MILTINIPDEHAAEILAANAQTFQAKRQEALRQRQQQGEPIPGTDQEIVEAVLKAQLISVASNRRAQQAKKDFEKSIADGNNQPG